MTLVHVSSALVFWGIVAGPIAGQRVVVPRRDLVLDSSAVVILRSPDPVVQDLSLVLRQSTRPQPRAKLDTIADELVRRAVDPVSTQKERTRAAMALWEAGRVEAGGGGRAVPYPGALERLIAIHRTSVQGEGFRSVSPILTTPPYRPALEYVSRVAFGGGPDARVAVRAMLSAIDSTDFRYRHLGSSDRAATLEVLRQVWLRAPGDSALRFAVGGDEESSPIIPLRDLAARYGWPKTDCSKPARGGGC